MASRFTSKILNSNLKGIIKINRKWQEAINFRSRRIFALFFSIFVFVVKMYGKIKFDKWKEMQIDTMAVKF